MEGWFDVTARPATFGRGSVQLMEAREHPTRWVWFFDEARIGQARIRGIGSRRTCSAFWRPSAQAPMPSCSRRAAWYLTKAGAFRLSLRSYGMELGHREPFSRKLPRRSGPELPRRPGTKSPSNDRLRSRRRGKRTQGRLAKWSSQPRSRPGRVPRRSAASRRAQRPATERAGL